MYSLSNIYHFGTKHNLGHVSSGGFFVAEHIVHRRQIPEAQQAFSLTHVLGLPGFTAQLEIGDSLSKAVMVEDTLKC